jgi:hypothetical protein
MAWTQRDIDAVKEAIATGASEVRLPDRQLTLRSLSELRQTLAMMEAEANPAGPRTRTIRFTTSKGLS